jgi:hypothetical protein
MATHITDKLKFNNGDTYILKDSNALPLTGGTLTGPITFNGSDVDRILMRINNTTGESTKTSYYGFTLKYLGSGTGDANSLALFTDNSTASTQTKSIEIR